LRRIIVNEVDSDLERDCHVVSDLAKLGFTFVHAATHELTMTLWLGEEPSRLPSYFSVSGMVIDAEGRVLMVRENRRRHLWKFPGGMAEPNEHLLETAERKVLEETGIIARAESVISLRQRRRTEYQGACGFFFVCLMKYIEDASVSLAETLADDIIAMKWFTRDDIKSLPKPEFFDHHRTIWNAYEKSLENSNPEDLMTEAGDRNVTSKLFNFSYF
ncbi:hydrolase, NUDIX family, partial [Ostertagia ostertagi]